MSPEELAEAVYALQRQVHDLLIWVKDIDTNVSALNRLTTDMYIKKSGGIPDDPGTIGA